MKNKSSIFLLSVGVLLLFSCKKEIPATIPTVRVIAMTNITAISADFEGEIDSDGGAPITLRGICWSTNQNPSITGNKIASGSGLGSFTGSITGLTAGAAYFVRAYAINEVGTAYSSQTTFTALALLPVLTTTSASTITSTSAISGGNITNDGGASITARGICWAKTSSPTINNSKTTDGTGSGSFASAISSLEPFTTYYIRAYATNGAGTSYGNEVTIKTLENIPTIPAYKTTSKYNTNGNATEELTYKWDSNLKDWVKFSKVEHSYYSKDHRNQSIYTNWDTSTQTWVNNSKDTFELYVFGKMWPAISYEWDILTKQWNELNKYDNYNADTNNKLLYVTLYNWDNLNYRWKEYAKYRYDFVFDIKGCIKQQTQVAYDASQYGYYGNKTKGVFTYDSNGKIIDNVWTRWDSTWGWTDSGLSTDISYDNNGNPTEKLTSRWDSNSSRYVLYRKFVYIYDSNGYQTECIEYSN